MPITYTVTSDHPNRIVADLLVLAVKQKRDIAGNVSPGLSRQVRTMMKRVRFDGNWSESALFADRTLARAPYLAVVGIGRGKQPSLAAEGIRRGLAQIIKDSRSLGVKRIVVSLGGLPRPSFVARAAVESADMTDYGFVDYSERLQKQHKMQALKKVIMAVDGGVKAKVRSAVRQAKVVGSGVELARNLVNMPSAAMSPGALVDQARQIAERDNNISLRIFNRQQAERAGFKAFLAVAQGSQREPYVIHLKYYPNGERGLKKIFFVGKGITFDSGGLSIKPADGMETMKLDMAGAATVLGVFSVLREMGINAEVHGVIGACENMPSGAAYRPGDIVRAKNGKTIEIVNTDAEGRVTLADTLSYAVEHEPNAIIDVATLTGACMVALGETVGGLWCNDDELAGRVQKAAKISGEGIDRMPMVQEYRQQIDSKVADLRNMSTSRYGGAVTAALFLKEFVGGIPWAHIDLAGPAYVNKPLIPYWDEGATGYGVRTLVELLKNFK